MSVEFSTKLTAAIEAAQNVALEKAAQQKLRETELKTVFERLAVETVYHNIEAIARSFVEHGWDKSTTHFVFGAEADISLMADILRMLRYTDRALAYPTVYLPFEYPHTAIKGVKCTLQTPNKIEITFTSDKW